MCSYCCVWLSEFSKAGLTKYLTKRQESINRHIMSLDYLKFFSYTWISWYVTFVHVFGSWTLGLWESFMWWESVARSFSLCDILVCSNICFSIPELGGVWIVSRLRLPQKCYHRQLSQLALGYQWTFGQLAVGHLPGNRVSLCDRCSRQVCRPGWQSRPLTLPITILSHTGLGTNPQS